MDPNATLAVMLDRAEVILADDREPEDGGPSHEAIELAEAVQNLSEWLSKGGFLPSAWAFNPNDKATHDRRQEAKARR